MKRGHIIKGRDFRRARGAATRAGLAAPDAYAATRAAVAALDAAFERSAVVVYEPRLAVAEDRLEDVSDQQLVELARDANAELQRRREAAA